MKSVTVKIKIASPKDAARPTSRTQDGIGNIIMTMTAMRANAINMVGLKRELDTMIHPIGQNDFHGWVKRGIRRIHV